MSSIINNKLNHKHRLVRFFLWPNISVLDPLDSLDPLLDPCYLLFPCNPIFYLRLTPP